MSKPTDRSRSGNYSLGGCLFSLMRVSFLVFILAILGFLGFDLWYRTTLKTKPLVENLRDQWTEIGEIFGDPRKTVTITQDGKVTENGKVVPLKEVANACLGNISAPAPPPEAWRSIGKGILLTQGVATITSLVILPDGKTLISGGRQLQVWDLDTRKLIRTLNNYQGKEDFINALALSPDGQTLASGDEKGRIILWNWKTGQIQKILSHEGVYQLAFGSNGTLLFSGSLRGSNIKQWRVQTGQALNTITSQVPVQKMAISPDGQTIAVASQSANAVEILRLSTGERVDLLIAGGQPEAIAFTPHGRILASASGGEQGIRLWNMIEGQPFRKLPIKVLKGHQGQPYAIAFSPDAKTLFATADGAEGKDYALTVWNACTGELIHRFGSQIRGHSMAISPDGKTIITGGRKGDIQMWRLP